MAAESSVLHQVPLSHHKRESELKRQHGANRGTSINTKAVAVLPAFAAEQFKIFERRGIILVLLWSFSSNIIFFFLSTRLLSTILVLNPTILVVSSLVLYPLLGWLADVRFSRYRVIKWSLRIMWLVSVFFCLASLLLDYFPPTNKSISAAIVSALNIALIAGLGGFQANIVQFGIDQLVAASSSEISSFISWCVWLWFFSEIPVILSQGYIKEDLFKSIPLLLLPLCLTISVFSDYIFNSCLVKEPPSSNPLTLIYKVLRYAVKNKYPRLRSAFTYWDDRRFSRIDLGKSKYGGPFTTEEVENVKTFWHLFSTILIASIFIGLINCTYPATSEIYGHLQGEPGTDIKNNFHFRFGSYLTVAFVPIYKFIIDPFLRIYFCIFPIKNELLLGCLLFLSSLTGYIIIEGVGRHLAQDVHDFNMTCPVDNIQDSITLPLNKMWTMIPNAFDGISKYFFVLAGSKFISAQSPYSMKSLTFGLVYGCLGLFTILSFVLLLLVQYAIKKWVPPHYGCEMWYLLFIFIVDLITAIILFLSYKFYKLRFRDDTLENEQMFAVNYYSQSHD